MKNYCVSLRIPVENPGGEKFGMIVPAESEEKAVELVARLFSDNIFEDEGYEFLGVKEHTEDY